MEVGFSACSVSRIAVVRKHVHRPYNNIVKALGLKV